MCFADQVAFFPNRGRRPIRVLMEVQRGGYTETDTKHEAFAVPAALRAAMTLVQNGLKVNVSQKNYEKQHIQTFATVNIRVLRVYMHKNDS